MREYETAAHRKYQQKIASSQWEKCHRRVIFKYSKRTESTWNTTWKWISMSIVCVAFPPNFCFRWNGVRENCWTPWLQTEWKRNRAFSFAIANARRNVQCKQFFNCIWLNARLLIHRFASLWTHFYWAEKRFTQRGQQSSLLSWKRLLLSRRLTVIVVEIGRIFLTSQL